MNTINYDGSKSPYLENYLSKSYPQLQLYWRDGVYVANVDDANALQALIDAYDPIPDAIADAIDQCDAWHASTLKAAVTPYTIEERETWSIKLEAAKAYLADTATDYQTAMLTAEAPAYGYTTEEHAQRIIEKSQAYHVLVGQLAGMREQAKNAIREADTLPQIQAVIDSLKS